MTIDSCTLYTVVGLLAAHQMNYDNADTQSMGPYHIRYSLQEGAIHQSEPTATNTWFRLKDIHEQAVCLSGLTEQGQLPYK